MNVVVLNERVTQISVVVGQGVHNVQRNLLPTNNRQAYVGSIIRRELIYHRSCEQVQDNLDHVNPALKIFGIFKK